MSQETKTGKAVIVSSLSLSPEDWAYLRSLAHELMAGEAKTNDPAIEFRRATTSQAVRHLIKQDRARRRTSRGNPVFTAGGDQARVLNMSTGTTTVQSFGEIEIDRLGFPPKARKSGRK